MRTMRSYFAATVLGVALTIVYVWGKVEVSGLMDGITGAEAEIVVLTDERIRLMAATVRAKKPAVIVRRAGSELGMVPSHRWSGESIGD